jgi:hypothetical protein
MLFRFGLTDGMPPTYLTGLMGLPIFPIWLALPTDPLFLNNILYSATTLSPIRSPLIFLAD